MIKKILTVVVPLLAPTIAYILYVYFSRKNKADEDAGRDIPHWRQWPWTILVPAGALLAALSLFILGLPGEDRDPGTYIPPRLEDGKIVPGEFAD